MVQDFGEELESTTMTSAQMLNSIAQPKRFYSECDEHHFFAWLRSIPAIKAFVGTPPQRLDLTVGVPVDRGSFYQPVGLLARSDIEQKLLESLCIGHADLWFSADKTVGTTICSASSAGALQPFWQKIDKLYWAHAVRGEAVWRMHLQT